MRRETLNDSLARNSVLQSQSLLSDIWRDREKITDTVASSESPAFANKKRCVIRHPKFDLVDEACWKWFCQQRSKGAPVSGVLLQEKARSFFAKLYPDADPQSFKGSTGWLSKFNTRHGIKNVQLRGEILSSDLSTIDPFREELAKVIVEEGYSRDQVFNADETGLWWRMTPSSSLNSGRVTRAANFKKAKDRVTLLACTNASGSHRLPLVFINKSAKPRCFKNMDMSTLPVHYYSQKFVPSVRRFCSENGLEKKALLLLDNAPSHPSSETLRSDDGKIKTMFLPPNTTAAIQPMDQAVLDPCKRHYKKKLLAHIILENESADRSVPDILKAITMKNVVYWVAAARKEASIDSLCKAWRNLLPAEESDEQDMSEDISTDFSITDAVQTAAPLGEDIQDAVGEWMEAGMNEPGHEVLDDDEIVADMLKCEDDDHEESSDEEAASSTHVTASEAFDALDVTLRWIEQTNADATHLLLVKKWHDEAARMRSQSMKQASILSYFHTN